MSLNDFLSQLKSHPETVEFEDTMKVIESHYDYTPAGFRNGKIINQATENQGSCKILAFAQHHQLTQEQTLHCFGDYYRKDVLQDPDANNHQNIRQFMTTGFSDLNFESQPLVERINK